MSECELSSTEAESPQLHISIATHNCCKLFTHICSSAFCQRWQSNSAWAAGLYLAWRPPRCPSCFFSCTLLRLEDCCRCWKALQAQLKSLKWRYHWLSSHKNATTTTKSSWMPEHCSHFSHNVFIEEFWLKLFFLTFEVFLKIDDLQDDLLAPRTVQHHQRFLGTPILWYQCHYC